MKTTLFWCFVLMVTTVFSKNISGLEESPTERKRALPPSFFAGNMPPVGLPDISHGIKIQQTLPPGTKPYFVSLFDPSTNTPFYSAYKVTPEQAKKLQTFSVKKDLKKKVWKNPPGAANVDDAYKEAITTDGEPLSRGHMNPAGINTFDINFMKATFTLTNAVPQFTASNGGPWEKFEEKIRNYAKDDCGKKEGTLYLLTGRSANGLILDLKGKPAQDCSNIITMPYLKDRFLAGTVRLKTPRAVWTAGCCVWKKPGKVFGTWWKANKVESFAVMSNNQKDDPKLFQSEMSVADLEKLLGSPLSGEVNLFPGNQNCRRAQNNIVLI